MSGLITSALWNWFLGWPWYAHVALAAGAVLFAWGALNGLYVLASKLGGWKAGVGAMLAVVGLVAALWPRKSTPDQYEHLKPGSRDAAPPVRRKKRPTIKLPKLF